MAGTAAFITGIPQWDDDRIFDPSAVPSYDPGAAAGYEGAWAFRHMRSILAANGIRLATLDVLEREGHDLRGLPVISHGWHSEAARALERGALPAVLFSWESPVVAWRLYHDLPRLSRLFKWIFLLPGAERRVRSPARFAPLLVARRREPVRLTGWESRKHLVFVIGYHTSTPISPGRLIWAALERMFVAQAPRGAGEHRLATGRVPRPRTDA